MKWRCCIEDLDKNYPQHPRPEEFTTIINDENVFSPSLLDTMQNNSEKLSIHLKNILCLSKCSTQLDNDNTYAGGNRPLRNDEILDYATMHDLPIFIGIDGSLKDDFAIVSICIVAPNILLTDYDNEWHSRPPKILLIRTWKLPKQWGTSQTCINMAETLGFIIGEYSIPSDLPIIFITNSNNARTLQRNLKNNDSFTHRKLIRQVKQGIEHSIANHLEHLTKNWPKIEQLYPYTLELYKKGEEICKIWARVGNNPSNICSHNFSTEHSTEYNSDDSWYTDTCSNDSDSSHSYQATVITHKQKFDSTMYDLLGHIIIVKVSSHQLESNMELKHSRRKPCPNLFVTSANQIADNAATQAHGIYELHASMESDICYNLPFSPRWSFSFEGALTNKGTTKVLYQKIDEELSLRQQHRPKQGVFLRMMNQNSIYAEQIGEETLL